jgi:hypothetical protein
MKKLLVLLLFFSSFTATAQLNYHQILFSTVRIKSKPALIFVQYNAHFFVTENITGDNENNFGIKFLGGRTIDGVTESVFCALDKVGQPLLSYKFMVSQGNVNGKTVNKIDVFMKNSPGEVEIDQKYIVRSYTLTTIK